MCTVEALGIVRVVVGEPGSYETQSVTLIFVLVRPGPFYVWFSFMFQNFTILIIKKNHYCVIHHFEGLGWTRNNRLSKYLLLPLRIGVRKR